MSTSDAGNGVGYTGFRIRGVAGRGINVMMNGVPFNDSESQGTFFVNVPDLTSSASQIVIQRGVGTSITEFLLLEQVLM
ncbi:TonB-dependent receptor plug domain-containing protein [Chryseobacterium indoltheticum]|uniref:TonB-dependent receptor plug domain-containing protein n=1 Tax=Chryseobacterium indoltheticum TaxID=254 RepID=UPI003F4985FE